MKVIIISDIHDNLANLKQCLDHAETTGVKRMICCGDLTNSETLHYMSDNFSGEIILVRGNIELYGEQEVVEHHTINYLGRKGYIEVDDKVIGVCHEPFFIDQLLERTDCNIIFYGHTHQPWEETRQNVRVINPGTLGGMFSRPTYAVWDTETNELEMRFI